MERWPILGFIDEIGLNAPFAMGIYYGTGKPSDSNELEMERISNDGTTFRHVTYSVQVVAFLADIPARSFRKGVIGHNGYEGCHYCVQQGEYIDSVVFPEINCRCPTDTSFRNQADPAHHKGVSILTRLKVDMVVDFPPDPMHLSYLGVQKQLITLLTMELPVPKRLRGLAFSRVNNNWFALKNCMPCDFQRKPRSLALVAKWKITEFRLFLLYIGVFIFNLI